jgi:hypothetical protein
LTPTQTPDPTSASELTPTPDPVSNDLAAALIPADPGSSAQPADPDQAAGGVLGDTATRVTDAVKPGAAVFAAVANTFALPLILMAVVLFFLVVRRRRNTRGQEL